MGRWTGENNPRWTGGRNVTPLGYVMAIAAGHPRANKNDRVFEHILVMEEKLGRYLEPGEVVHHINQDRADNRPENLQLCADERAHKLLHRQLRAQEACGHPDWLKCAYCKQYDDPSNLYVYQKKGTNSTFGFHRKCSTEYNAKLVKSKRAAN